MSDNQNIRGDTLVCLADIVHVETAAIIEYEYHRQCEEMGEEPDPVAVDIMQEEMLLRNPSDTLAGLLKTHGYRVDGIEEPDEDGDILVWVNRRREDELLIPILFENEWAEDFSLGKMGAQELAVQFRLYMNEREILVDGEIVEATEEDVAFIQENGYSRN